MSIAPDETVLEDWLPLSQAARQYGFVHPYLRQLAIRKRLKARKIGRDWFTTRTWMNEFVASRQKRGAFKRIKAKRA